MIKLSESGKWKRKKGRRDKGWILVSYLAV
jgi:hypothetical protein